MNILPYAWCGVLTKKKAAQVRKQQQKLVQSPNRFMSTKMASMMVMIARFSFQVALHGRIKSNNKMFQMNYLMSRPWTEQMKSINVSIVHWGCCCWFYYGKNQIREQRHTNYNVAKIIVIHLIDDEVYS